MGQEQESMPHFFVYHLSRRSNAESRSVIRVGAEIPEGAQQLGETFLSRRQAEEWARDAVEGLQHAGMAVIYEEEE